MAKIEIRNLDKFYRDLQALFGVTIDIEDGEFVVFVGPSGCGKSTLLRCIAGLEAVDGGSIAIGGQDVTRTEPAKRGVAMVFQSYALYPHMSVRENMEFGLKVNGVGPEERGRRVAEAARILQLSDLLDRKPGELSGGQRQRVAIGRAIVKDPKVFLFDEPLSNLDAKLRVQMRVELEALHRQLNATMVYVTHDQVEAMTMADRIVVLNGGRVEQFGTPMEIYHRPATRFVAEFIGSPAMNVFDAQLVSGLGVHPQARWLGCRPEHLEIVAPGAGHLDARVKARERLGSETLLHLEASGGLALVVRLPGDDDTEIGTEVGVRIPEQRLHQFDANGRALG